MTSNGTYDNDPSRDPRFPHGAGALLGIASGLLLIGLILLEGRLHLLAWAWYGG